MTLEAYELALTKARAVQAKQVMPLIGPLLDAWEEVPNDLRGMIREQAPTLAQYLDRLDGAMCADIGSDGQ